MTPYFYDLFDSVEAIRADFCAPDALSHGSVLIAASYSYEDYSGFAAVVYVNDGAVYEVYGSHCSCYGLEGQWKPELAHVGELRSRMNRRASEDHDLDWFGVSPQFARHVVQALDELYPVQH